MICRRTFVIGGAAAAVSSTPALANTPPVFELAPELKPQWVRVTREVEAGRIVVVTAEHFLYWVTEPGKAIRYGVGVGKAGLSFRGDAVIQRKAKWPSWRPTSAMIQREPHKYEKFKDGVPGGPTNPLGSRALYLYQGSRDTYFRIHGTTQPSSIGRSVSNGCIRMLNTHVADLYERVPLGTRVSVY